MRKFSAGVLFIACMLVSGPLHAAWPERTVTVLVPYAAGGLTDVMARLIAAHLQAKFQQSFVVQNEVGAGGTIATASAAHAKPDGYTLFFGPIALLTLSPLTMKVNYDPDHDFIPVSILASTPFVITVTEKFPATTLAEFIAEVKKKPDGYSYGSAGAATTTHAASVLFLKTAGLKMVHVPYRGVAPAFTDLIAGNIQMVSASPVELKPYVNSPKVRPLGITSDKRSQHLPKVPTVAETMASPNVATYNGFLAPKGTPEEIVDRLAAAVVAAVKTQEFSSKLVNVGLEPFGSTREQMAKTIAADKKNWVAVKDDIMASMK